MYPNTLSQYNAIIKTCQTVFEKKTKDYGTAWRILRLPSVTDQLMIKAQRIRAIQEQPTQRVDEGISTELIGIVNYSIMALMQIALKNHQDLELAYDKLAPLYNEIVATTIELLNIRNADHVGAGCLHLDRGERASPMPAGVFEISQG